MTPPGEPLRALIVSASFGSGHHQANDAVDRALWDLGTPLEARHADLLKYLGPVERTALAGTYDFWLRHTPGLYRAFYRWTDRDSSPTDLAFRYLGRAAMRRDVREVRPAVVLSSYPTSVALADWVRREERLDFLNALVVTDYRVHHHWARPEAELLMVASDDAREEMLARGIPSGRVVVTGIPIAPVFRDLIGADRAALRERHGLKPDAPLVLLSGGGTGSYRALGTVLTELGNLGPEVQVLVLAGATKRGVTRLGGATAHYLGFTNAFPELLAASDLVVGKAGGLTVAEATALGVPMVIYDPIPGQEEHNAEFLERHGAALWVRERRTLRAGVLRALDPDEYARLSANARAVGVPDAAERVASALLARLGRT